MSEVRLQTGLHIFEVLANVCHSPLEAMEQFVENAADAVEQTGVAGGCIRIHLEHSAEGQEASSMIMVEDNGIGLGPEKMRQVVQRIGDSEKVGQVLRGEKGIGLLSFASIAQELHLCSRDVRDGPSSSCLVLKRERLRDSVAQVMTPCPQNHQVKRGTRAYLMGILPEVAPLLSRARIKRHLGREFAADLRGNLYGLFIGDKHGYEPIKPSQFQGIPVTSVNLNLHPFGCAHVELYALPFENPEAAVDLFGRGGIRLSTLTALEEFQRQPWLSQRLEGSIRYDRLQGTADKAAVVQNEQYKALAEALRGLEPCIVQGLERVAQEYLDNRLTEIMNKVDIFIGRFLHLLRRDSTGDTLLPLVSTNGGGTLPVVKEAARPRIAISKNGASLATRHERTSPSYLRANLWASVSDEARYRTWSDDKGVLQINALHPDFLAVERDNTRCAWYLFSAWAKQYLLTEYGDDATVMADEMVGLLSRAGPMMNQINFHSLKRAAAVS
ncbi:MAG: ATP-binding protein [Chloroflexi bacterium]|nr:ATP-binding protein [Chloroflexota bacterium]